MFQQCSVIITHAGMSLQHILLCFTSPIRSSFPCSYSRLMVRKPHQGHQGGEGMVRRTREVMYCPAMRAAIPQESASCSVCASYSSSQPKEPTISYKIPHGHWKFISQDLFRARRRWYPLTVDHNSDWFEVDLVNEGITMAHVISVTKAHFALYGVSDSFCQTMDLNISLRTEFAHFAKAYDFKFTFNSILEDIF